MQRGTRYKASDEISFPEILDLKSLLNTAGEEAAWANVNLEYELYGILFHKGSSPHSGHYGNTHSNSAPSISVVLKQHVGMLIAYPSPIQVTLA